MDPYGYDAYRVGPGLDMNHGFLHYIRNNQLTRRAQDGFAYKTPNQCILPGMYVPIAGSGMPPCYIGPFQQQHCSQYAGPKHAPSVWSNVMPPRFPGVGPSTCVPWKQDSFIKQQQTQAVDAGTSQKNLVSATPAGQQSEASALLPTKKCHEIETFKQSESDKNMAVAKHDQKFDISKSENTEKFETSQEATGTEPCKQSAGIPNNAENEKSLKKDNLDSDILANFKNLSLKERKTVPRSALLQIKAYISQNEKTHPKAIAGKSVNNSGKAITTRCDASHSESQTLGEVEGDRGASEDNYLSTEPREQPADAIPSSSEEPVFPAPVRASFEKKRDMYRSLGPLYDQFEQECEKANIDPDDVDLASYVEEAWPYIAKAVTDTISVGGAHLRELGFVLVQRALQDTDYVSVAVPLCCLIMSKESDGEELCAIPSYSFRKGVLEACSESLSDWVSLLSRAAFQCINLVDFLYNTYTRSQITRFAVLLLELLRLLATPPAVHNFYLVQQLCNVLHETGKELQQENSSSMTLLISAIRDAFLEPYLDPCIRHALVALLELAASDWTFTEAAQNYYFAN